MKIWKAEPACRPTDAETRPDNETETGYKKLQQHWMQQRPEAVEKTVQGDKGAKRG